MTQALLRDVMKMKEVTGARSGDVQAGGPPLPGIGPGARGRVPLIEEKGIASLTHKGKTLRFRTNPNEIWWTYNLKTCIEQTYGGRVVQLLGTTIDDLVVKAEIGNGRWEYMMDIVNFMRDLMIDQRGGEPATFEYTTRGWILDVYAVSVPFEDDVKAVTRPFELNFKVQEDISGVMSQASLSSELARLKDGIGWKKSKFNQPNPSDQEDGETGWFGMGQIGSQISDLVSELAPQIGSALSSIPGLLNPGGLGSSAGANP